jgi:hypothetical protein
MARIEGNAPHVEAGNSTQIEVACVPLSSQQPSWEKVHTAFNEAEFHLITGILAGEGVEWRVKSSRVPQLPFANHDLGAIEIYVPKLDAPMAQRILMVYRNS